MNGTLQLARYDAMCQAIAAAHEIDEVAEIRDQALAIQLYMAQRNNVEAEKRAIEIRLRAERKLGQLLAKADRSQGRRTDLETSFQPGKKLMKDHLSDHGISQTQAHRWQKLAAVPQEEFEATFAGSIKPSTNGIIAKHAPKKNAQAEPVPPTYPVDDRRTRRNEEDYGMARRNPPRKVTYFEPSPPRFARNTVIEPTFEVGRRFRCPIRVDCD